MALSDILVRINADSSAFMAEMSPVNRELNKLFASSSKATSGFAALGARMSSIGSTLTVGITAPLVAFGAGAVKTAADMEALRAGLAATTKETGPLENQLKRLQEVAKLPGLGLREAIQGSTNLQAAGFSATLAERSLKAFGNALATVGKGKAELDGVTLALSQIASKGKISAEEINQLAERVPQIRVAMKDAFGTADTEVLQKAGIGAEEFVTKVVQQLEKLKLVTGGTKNSFENLSDTLTQTGDRIGAKLLPAVNALIPYLETGIKYVGDLADAFTRLDQPTQTVIIGLTGLAAIAGPAFLALGKVSSMFAELGITAPIVGSAIGVVVLAFQSMQELVLVIERLKETAYQFNQLGLILVDGKKGVELFKGAIDYLGISFPSLSDKVRAAFEAIKSLSTAATLPGFALFRAALDAINSAAGLATGRSREMDSAIVALNQRNIEAGAGMVKLAADMKNYGGATEVSNAAVKNSAAAHSAAAVAVSGHAKALHSLKLPTEAMLILHERSKQADSEKQSALSKMNALMAKYNAITYEQAQLNIQVADSAARYFRVLSQAPDMGGITAGIKVPVFKQPKFGDKPFDGGAPNVGEGGMMTKEQAEAIKGRYKDLGKAATAAMKQVSTVVTDLSRGISDVIFQGGKVGDMLQKIAKQAGQAIVRELIEGALTKLSKKLLDVGGVFGKIFGGAGGGGGTIFSAAAGGGASAASGAAGAAGSVGGLSGAVSSSLTSIVGAVAQVGTMVSSIVGNFQFMAMNKTLDLIEHEVRYSQIHLLNTLNKANEFWPYMKNCWESLVRMEERGGGLAAAGGSSTVNVSLAGAYLMSDSQMADFAERLARFMKARGL